MIAGQTANDASSIRTAAGNGKRFSFLLWQPHQLRFTFVGGHPLGGAAKGGLEHARPDLFAGRPWLFTPTSDATGGAVEKLFDFARALGAHPQIVSVSATVTDTESGPAAA